MNDINQRLRKILAEAPMDGSQALTYLRRHGIHLTGKVLKNYREMGIGPRTCNEGRKVRYSKAELDRFLAVFYQTVRWWPPEKRLTGPAGDLRL